MKLVSWNVNGLRAAMKKGFMDFFDSIDADILCLQEIKMKEDQWTFEFPNKYIFINSAERPGYSGTAVITKIEPKEVTFGIGIPEHDDEGRVITCEFDDFYLVNCYTPNSKRGLERLEYRTEVWENLFRKYLLELDSIKPVILCGDLNVAHKEIDLKNPDTNRRNAGFTDEEREMMTKLLDSGFIDTFRYFYPDATDRYSWWSYFRKSRDRNIGWRIDYFLVSNRLEENLVDADILDEVLGSDHCPIQLEIKF
ncbi:exodeoxyribonuclease III [Lagierella sp.]|uniref:exodeoxyribonuclease III n=1 Tax=Lagierella sp. TaxID=2849657 RepID=UPI00262C74B9|nr:exodeoxyribonuclease III [Lagierella sp.]